MPSLLIYTATIGDQMRPETKASIEAQITDIECTWELGFHNPYPGEKMRNVVAQYQRARQLMLDGGYDALMTVEHDMVIPANAVQKLYETDAPVVYGVYMLRHNSHTLNAWQYVNNRNIGMSLSLYPKELKAARARGWAQVSGVGWGCTLIRREVLERLTVHSSGGGDAGDLTFATDCLRAGIKMIARFDVPCLHIEPDGTVLEPFKFGGIVNRVYALVDVVANIDGQSKALKKGHYYSLPPDVAGDLQRAGYVRLTNDEIETADATPQQRETATVKQRRVKK